MPYSLGCPPLILGTTAFHNYVNCLDNKRDLFYPCKYSTSKKQKQGPRAVSLHIHTYSIQSPAYCSPDMGKLWPGGWMRPVWIFVLLFVFLFTDLVHQ